MTLIKHELRQNRISFWIWTSSIAFMIGICIFMYPEMKGEVDAVNDMFSSMGSFTAAFGMDKLNFGTLIGFYAVEGGNMLGLGGAFFAALIAINSLAKEEKDRTAEFLFAHPVSRTRIITEKLLAVLLQLTCLNVIVWLLSVASVAAIGEEIPWKEINLLHLAYFLMQIEIAGICFGLSAFLRRGGLGIGLGLATILYFLNIIANISDSASFLKYITPFGYTEGSEIIANGSLDGGMLAAGALLTLIGIVAAYLKYTRKDLH